MGCGARALVLLILPVLLIGPSLRTGRLFLPITPAALEPLASENPAAAAAGLRRANYWAIDRLFPIQTDAMEMRAQLTEGAWPLWDDGLGLGQPLAAASMFGPWYPPHWLAFVLPPEQAGPWMAMLSLFLAGLGLWLFLGRLGLSFAACAIGALALQGGGFALANLHLGMKVEAALWFPWCLWAIEGLLQKRRGSGLALFAASALPFLAGFPSIAVFACVATLAVILWRRFVDHQSELPAARACALVVLGVLATSVQLVPTAAASLQSMRRPQGAGLMEQSLPLASLYTLVAPEAFGTPTTAQFAGQSAMVWWKTPRHQANRAENANLLEWYLFCGVAVFVLAAVGLGSDRRARLPALLLAVLLGFIVGLPVLRWATLIPGLNLGAPARAASVAWVVWPWLAALGVESLRKGKAAGIATGLVTALALALLGYSMWRIEDPALWANTTLVAELAERHAVSTEAVLERLPSEARQSAATGWTFAGLSLTLAALSAAAAVCAVGFLRRGPLIVALLVLAGVVLHEGVRGGRPHLEPRELSPEELFFPSRAMREIAKAAGDGRVIRIDGTESGVSDVVDLARPNMLAPYGIRDLTPYTVFTPRNLVELASALDPRTRYRSGICRLPDVGLVGHRILDLLRVTAVLSREPVRHPRLQPVYETKGLHVYRRTGVPAPARVVAHAFPTTSDSTVLEVLSQGLLDPATHTVLAPGVEPIPLPDPASAAERPGSVEVIRRGPARTEVRVFDSAGGWLVLADGWYPGWRASVNGRETPIARVDHALRAVPVGPGNSKVLFWYAPGSLKLGALLSIVATLLALAILRRSRRRSSLS